MYKTLMKNKADAEAFAKAQRKMGNKPTIEKTERGYVVRWNAKTECPKCGLIHGHRYPCT